jgi:hypothetical protein
MVGEMLESGLLPGFMKLLGDGINPKALLEPGIEKSFLNEVSICGTYTLRSIMMFTNISLFIMTPVSGTIN